MGTTCVTCAYRNLKPECLAIKSVVSARIWDIGVAVLLFDERQSRHRKGTNGRSLASPAMRNPDTWPLAHHMGAKIYKRYRFTKKKFRSANWQFAPQENVMKS